MTQKGLLERSPSSRDSKMEIYFQYCPISEPLQKSWNGFKFLELWLVKVELWAQAHSSSTPNAKTVHSCKRPEYLGQRSAEQKFRPSLSCINFQLHLFIVQSWIEQREWLSSKQFKRRELKRCRIRTSSLVARHPWSCSTWQGDGS